MCKKLCIADVQMLRADAVAIEACMRKNVPNSTVLPTKGANRTGYARTIMTADDDRKLDDLTRQYPGWRIWRGHVTGDVWALPPRRLRQLGLVSAADVDALAAKVAE